MSRVPFAPRFRVPEPSIRPAPAADILQQFAESTPAEMARRQLWRGHNVLPRSSGIGPLAFSTPGPFECVHPPVAPQWKAPDGIAGWASERFGSLIRERSKVISRKNEARQSFQSFDKWPQARRSSPSEERLQLCAGARLSRLLHRLCPPLRQ